MTLHARLSLMTTALAFLVASGFGLLAYGIFVRHQDAQLRALLDQDLTRVTGLLARPTLGASFVESDVDSFILQFVAPDDRVVMSWGAEQPLPLASSPQVVQLDGKPYLVAHAPWETLGGTIRLAHDIEGARAARVDLRRILILSGALVTLTAALAGLVTTRNLLRPLSRLSAQARSLDPAFPEGVRYEGPRDEIHEVATALEEALAAIRARQDEERAFLLEIAHELAAPLTLVQYHLTTTRRDHPDDPSLAAATDAAQELLRTSQDLLVLARGELERPLEPRVFALDTLLERVEAEYPGITVHATTRGEVVGDPDRLMQVVRNLVRNGIQAAGSPAAVQVVLRSDEERIVLDVVDQGPGIREEALERVFERRYSERRGIGVGLSVAKSLVEQHGGRIEASSSRPHGSRFSVVLPSLESRLEATPPGSVSPLP